MANTARRKKILYSADQTPPKGVLILSSLQQMLVLISIGMAVPVSVARIAGLDLLHSSSFLAASLLCMGVASIVQTFPGKFLGSGYQSFSACDSAAISACVLAAELGGIPLVLGMTVYSCILRFVLGSFAFRLRKLFPAEVTGTMIFILGINLIPTSFKYFIGTGGFDPMHLVVAGATLLFMLACSLFIKPLKPYSALAGVAFGYLLSIATGVFDISSFSVIRERSVVALPIYAELSYSFDVRMLVPFFIISIAGIVDNIGDFTAVQAANDPNMKKTDWRSIERGIRGGSLASGIIALLGGAAQSTSTANIGIAGASGITSRKVAYVAGGMLIVVSFFPGVMSVLSMIPEPVLGAVLMYSMCYIMSGGFSTLMSLELSDRRIFTVFLSIAASVSTLIPGLYDFLPKSVSDVLISPMIMGVIVLMVTTLFCRIGTHKKFEILTEIDATGVKALNEQIDNVCCKWNTQLAMTRQIKAALNAVCEGVFEQDGNAKLRCVIRYDTLQVKMHIETDEIGEVDAENITVLPSEPTSLSIALAMLPKLFDNVNVKWKDGALIADMSEDIR